jgi:hypothetical protein
MDFWIILGAIGSIASVVALVLPLQTKYQRVMHLVYGLFIVVLTTVAVQYWHQNQRVKKIERAAIVLVADRQTYSEVGFAQAALAFLEKNRDLYPDTYARAQKLCELNNCLGAKYGEQGRNSLEHAYNQIDVASALEGLLKGIGTLESGS